MLLKMPDARTPPPLNDAASVAAGGNPFGLSRAVGAFRRRAASHETKLRFLIAGGVNTAFGLAIYPVLMWTLGPRGLHYMAALVIAQIVSVLFAYGMQKLFVFRTRGDHGPELLKFSTFYLGYFVANAAALPFLVEIAHAKPVIAQFGLSLGVIAGSYFWHSRITFRDHGKPG